MTKDWIVDTKHCTGCGACVNICSSKAIRFAKDSFGFQFPQIDEDACIRCGACERVCPALRPVSREEFASKAYAVTNRDPEIQAASTSAGVFYALARKILEENGVVFGCAWDTPSRARHISVFAVEDLKLLQKSKYVQSDIGLCYAEAEGYLKAGKKVLFSGTPCQIAGLKNYLKRDYEDLLIVDFVCHGVPNGDVLEAFLKHQEQIRGAAVTGIEFRHKIPGVSSYITRIAFAGEKGEQLLLEPWQGTSYGYLFMKSYLSRESCYDCRYASVDRISDITLGDYWGGKAAHPDLDDSNGIGLVIVSSEKGGRWFACVEEELVLRESALENAAKGNSQLRESAQKPLERDELMDRWSEEGYSALERFYESRKKEVASALSQFRLMMKLPGLHSMYQKAKKGLKKIVGVRK